jgi:hypothetical protein
MGLRAQAALDAKAILEDSSSGFGMPFTLKSPDGVSVQLTGFTTDVGQTIDPETGQAVAGRQASVACALSSLPAMPTAVSSETRKPWVVTFASSAGVLGDWKVTEVLPDRAVGVVVLLLEAYHAGAHL